MKDYQTSTFESFIAGGVGGFCGVIVGHPLDTIKVQMSSGNTTYSGPIDALRKLYRHGGLKSVYRGTGATLLRDVPGTGIYFLTYEWLKASLANPYNPLQFSVVNTLVAGGVAGVCNWTVILPIDVLKSRYQTAPDGLYPRGIRSVFKEFVQTEGLSALSRGAAPLIIRAFVASAACFLGYELMLQLLQPTRIHL